MINKKIRKFLSIIRSVSKFEILIIGFLIFHFSGRIFNVNLEIRFYCMMLLMLLFEIF